MHREGRNDRLERPGRRVRVRRVRRRHAGRSPRRSPRRGAFSIAGGGDTVAAINKFGIADRISYISTARRRVPRVPRGQDAAGRRGARSARRSADLPQADRRPSSTGLRHMPRSTKIVATLGPASNSPEMLSRLLAAGVDVVRLNFSHGAAADHIERARIVREAAQAQGREVGIMVDLQGPKIRIGKFADGRITLVPGATLHARRRLRAGRRRARRPRLPGARPRRRRRRGAAARRRADQARGRAGPGLAHRHARGAGRRAVEQQGHQPAGRRPVGAGADRQGHGRRQDGGGDRGRLPRGVVPEEQGRHVHGAPAAARRRRPGAC